MAAVGPGTLLPGSALPDCLVLHCAVALDCLSATYTANRIHVVAASGIKGRGEYVRLCFEEAGVTYEDAGNKHGEHLEWGHEGVPTMACILPPTPTARWPSLHHLSCRTPACSTLACCAPVLCKTTCHQVLPLPPHLPLLLQHCTPSRPSPPAPHTQTSSNLLLPGPGFQSVVQYVFQGGNKGFAVRAPPVLQKGDFVLCGTNVSRQDLSSQHQFVCVCHAYYQPDSWPDPLVMVSSADVLVVACRMLQHQGYAATKLWSPD